MSATTVLESFDTQMDYSGDIDVAMLAASSSDPWQFQGESITMDQDSHPDSHSSAVTNRDESVEVDMEDSSYLEYTGHEHAEYEMVDEDAHYQQEGSEILDVEVYDAATDEPSPAPMPLAYDAPQLSAIPSVDYTFESSPSVTDVAITEVHVSPTQAHTDLQSFDGSVASIPILSANTADTLDDTRIAEYTNNVATNVEPSAPSTNAEGHEEADALAPEPSAGEQPSENPAEYSAVEPTVSTNETEHIPQTVTVSAQEGVEADTSTVAENPAVPLPAVENIASEHVEDVAEDTEHQYTGDAHEDGHEELHNHPDEVSAQEITNPSEPGFGVDPPPPIHLSFELADLAEVCLFNRPSDTSGSLTPQDGNLETDTASFTVLMHHRPLLYFATLDQVFAALREEEYIAQIPHIAEGEIILDAYDLQLVITEDNAYAREVSLHDLEYLHAGCDISGPLRLRLHLSHPRFLNRYQSLRDQIDRLNIAREASEHPEEAAHDHAEQSYEEHHEEHSQDLVVEHVHHENEQTAPPEEVAKPNVGAIHDDLHSVEADYETPHDSSGAGQVSAEVREQPAPSTEQVADDAAPHDGEEDAHDAASLNQSEHESEEYFEGEDYDDSYQETGVEEQELEEDHPEGLQDTDAPQKPEDVDAPTVPRQLSNELLATEDTPLAGGEVEPVTEGDQTELSEQTAAADDAESSHFNTDHNENPDGRADESDVNFVALLEQEADLPENEAKESTPVQQETQQLNTEPEYPELEDDPEWDDDLDAEGEIDTAWAADNDDEASNQSTVTLSSTGTVPKRTYDEFDSDVDEAPVGQTPETISPGSKRARIA